MRISIPPLVITYKNGKFILEGREIKPLERKLSELEDVLLDKEALRREDRREIAYLILRDLHREEDREIFEKNEVRFDVTILFSRFIGDEFNKTFGHYHPLAEKNLSYPEIYEVVRGRAFFVLQHFSSKEIVDSIVVLKAKKNDKILIPPNYGHTTINIGKKNLVLANLVSRKFSSIYEFYKDRRGAGVYIVRSTAKKKYKSYFFYNIESIGKRFFEIVKNPYYKENFEFLYIEKTIYPFKISLKHNIYKAFIENPERFSFLNKPSLLAEKREII